MLKKLIPFMALMMAMAACGASSTPDKDAAAADSAKINTTQDMASQSNPADSGSVKVEVTTSLGSFTVLLYGDTPAHRDNFLKHVKDGTYEGTLFHRVISNFMVQAGDPDSKTAKPRQMLGSGDVGYTLEAEINFPRHYHKRGALAAARQGDQVNPQRRSSGCQFYVVTGEKYTEPQLNQFDRRLEQSGLQAHFNKLAQDNMDSIMALQQKRDSAGLHALQDRLIAETEAWGKANPLRMSAEMRQDYTTIGGTPHLDNEYTVFGEVVAGMDVIDKIEKVETDSHDRPTADVKIISMKVLD